MSAQSTPSFASPEQHSTPINEPDIRPALDLQMAELELLHNFSVSTCFTLSSNPGLKTLWRTSVPEIGFSHDFVMRGILAVSALHMAHFKPEKRASYLAQAVLHHQIALQTAMSMLLNITEHNCAALYVFSMLTAIFALAKPRKPGDFLLVGEDDIAEWLFLIQGTRAIVTMTQETLVSGNLGPILTAGARRHQLRQRQSSEENRLGELQYLISGTVADKHTRSIYTTSIAELRKSFAVASNSDTQALEATDVFIWVYAISEDYLGLLKQQTPEALAIFAYFCVLLKRLDSHWWVQGSSVHLISRIYRLLDEEHRLWIRWPIEEIGWIPSLEEMVV